MLAESFSVKTLGFEGPLDLLLDMIESRKLLVNDISLAQVASDYISYVQAHEDIPMDDISRFLVIASTLILIKSRSLLPNLDLTTEERSNIKDLEERLVVLQKFREASLNVRNMFGQTVMFARAKEYLEAHIPRFSPGRNLSVNLLKDRLKTVLNNMPKFENKLKVGVKATVSIEEMITRLMARIQGALAFRFSSLAADSREKIEVVISFLALLELVKQGAVAVAQREHCGEIEIEGQAIGIPRYG